MGIDLANIRKYCASTEILRRYVIYTVSVAYFQSV